MSKKRTFSEEEIKQIIKWYTEDNFSINYIASKKIKCRNSTISKILKDNNVKKKTQTYSRRFNKEEEKEIIDLYENGRYSQREISEKFSCSPKTVHNILVKNNVELKNQPKKNKNQLEDYFDIIDNEHKAYWLGFIFADGSIHRNNLSIEIHEKDRMLLEQFKNDLQLNSKISHRKRKNTSVCCVRMTSTHLCETLAKYGIVPNKTYVTKHLPEIKKELLPHFLRGLIDGDGWITEDKQGYFHLGFVSNSASICEDFKKYCNLLTGNQCKANITYKDKEKNIACFQVQNQKAVKQLATALYKDNTICLSRKYRMVEPLFDFKNDENIV